MIGGRLHLSAASMNSVSRHKLADGHDIRRNAGSLGVDFLDAGEVKIAVRVGHGYMRPGTRRTFRGPAIQIASADTAQSTMASTKASR